MVSPTVKKNISSVSNTEGFVPTALFNMGECPEETMWDRGNLNVIWNYDNKCYDFYDYDFEYDYDNVIDKYDRPCNMKIRKTKTIGKGTIYSKRIRKNGRLVKTIEKKTRAAKKTIRNIAKRDNSANKKDEKLVQQELEIQMMFDDSHYMEEIREEIRLLDEMERQRIIDEQDEMYRYYKRC